MPTARPTTVGYRRQPFDGTRCLRPSWHRGSVLAAGTSRADVVILTALAIEKDAMVAALGGGVPHPWNGVTMHRAELAGQIVLVVPIGGMGTARAAQTAQLVIDVWNPARLLLAGIMAGVPDDDLRLGDVAVPNQVVGYELAKVRPGAIEPRWEVFRPDRLLVDAALDMPPAEWVHAIGVARPDGTDGRVIPRARFGTVLSGDKVLADAATVADLRTSWPKMVGVEMESLGVAVSAYRNGPGFFMAKGVSDFADPGKDDTWQRYAAAVSAAYLVALLRRAPNMTGPRAQAVPAPGLADALRTPLDGPPPAGQPLVVDQSVHGSTVGGGITMIGYLGGDARISDDRP